MRPSAFSRGITQGPSNTDTCELSVLEVRAREEAAEIFQRDVQNSSLFKDEWSQLLAAAPLALNLIGICCAAASSSEVHAVTLEKATPIGGFKYVRHPDLKACLVQLANSGITAFTAAEKRMASINQASTSLGRYAVRIMRYLPELPDSGADQMIRSDLKKLKDTSATCLKHAKLIEEQFQDWLDLVCELHEVTQAMEGKTVRAQAEDQAKRSGVGAKLKFAKESYEQASEAAKEAKKRMDVMHTLFKAAVKDMPGPWETIALELFGGLRSAFSSIVTQALPGKRVGKKDASLGELGGETASNKQRRVKHQEQPADSATTYAVSKACTDIAYPASLLVAPLIAVLVEMLGAGTNQGVDWDSLSSENQPKRESLARLRTLFGHIQNLIPWKDSAQSMELKSVVETALDLIQKLETASRNLHLKKPDLESISEWQKTVEDIHAKVSVLATVATCLPGSTPASALPDNPPSRGTGGPSTGTMSLRAAQEKVNVARAAYMAALENSIQASKQAYELAGIFAETNASLESLGTNITSLAEIQQLLVKCIGALIPIKEQINNLVLFFTALSLMVEHVVEQGVCDLSTQADIARNKLVQEECLLDIQKQDLYVASLTCQAYFSLFEELAAMYQRVSNEHIQPNLQLCNRLLNPTDNRSPSEKLQRLQRLCQASQVAINEMISQEQKRVKDTLSDRIERLSPLPEISNTITGGREVIPAATNTALDVGIGYTTWFLKLAPFGPWS